MSAPHPTTEAPVPPAPPPPGNIVELKEESGAKMILWLGLALCVMTLLGSALTWMNEYRAYPRETVIALEAAHPAWVQVPIRGTTLILFLFALRWIRRVESDKAAARAAALISLTLLTVDILATTRLTIHRHTNSITVRILDITVYEYLVPKRHQNWPCYQVYDRGFRTLEIDDRTISPPWLPLRVDWHEFEDPDHARYQAVCPASAADYEHPEAVER